MAKKKKSNKMHSCNNCKDKTTHDMNSNDNSCNHMNDEDLDKSNE